MSCYGHYSIGRGCANELLQDHYCDSFDGKFKFSEHASGFASFASNGDAEIAEKACHQSGWASTWQISLALFCALESNL